MIVYPNAKINIGLNVEARRADGFHDIATLFYPVHGLCDVLEVIVAQGQSEPLRFTQSGLAIAGDVDSNLCVRAFGLMSQRLELPPLAVHLHKQIPMGAGLGGGSADGAFMLMAINEIMAKPLNDSELSVMALALGSDCPFFLRNAPCVGRGRGERLSPTAINLHGMHLLLLLPDFGVSTAAAYGGVRPAPWTTPIEQLLQLPISQWGDALSNDFEPTVFAMHPQLAELKERLYASGAVYAAMSGSGSTMYGLFAESPNLSAFADVAHRLVGL